MSSIVSPSKPVTNAIWLPLLGVYLASTAVLSIVFISQALKYQSSTDPVTRALVISYIAMSVIVGLVFILKYMPLVAIAKRRLRGGTADVVLTVTRRYRHVLLTTTGLDLALIALPCALPPQSGDASLGIAILYFIVIPPILLTTTLGASLILAWRLHRV